MTQKEGQVLGGISSLKIDKTFLVKRSMQNSDYYILKNESPEGGPKYRKEDFEDQ